MRIIFAILTTQCNRNCSYCFYNTGIMNRGKINTTLQTDAKLFQAMRKAGVEKIVLTGGEPLLLNDIVDRVRLATEFGMYSLILTNGDLLSEELLQNLVDAGLCALYLSIDNITGGTTAKAPWQAMNLLKAHPHLKINVITVVSHLNLPHMHDIIGGIYQNGFFSLVQPVYIPRTQPLSEKISLDLNDSNERKKFGELLDYWIKLYGMDGKIYPKLMHDYYCKDHPPEPPPRCLMGPEIIVINNDGNVVPCFHRMDLNYGNIKESDPFTLIDRAYQEGQKLATAPCYGEHCISLFNSL